MKHVLNWDKPKKVMSTEDWKSISADGAPPGTYTPNMSSGDREKWKAKKVGGKDPRIEIRKTAVGQDATGQNHYAQTLLIVRPDGTVVMSANGKALLEADELMAAIVEAIAVLREEE